MARRRSSLPGPVLAVALAFALSGCGESGPVTVHLFGLDPGTGKYGEFDARLDTLDDVTQMRGDAVRFVGNATVVEDLVAAARDPTSPDRLRVEGGMPPDCSFTPRDGVLYADDYDSLDMASAYWALDRARQLFVELGVDPSLLTPLPAYYHPRLQLGTKLIPTFFVLTDNAAYATDFDGFLIVPHILMPGSPFTTNLGVMTHEYGHRVFNLLVNHGAKVDISTANDWTTPAQRQFQGLNEGLSDEFGFLITRDPDFIRVSLGGIDLPSIDRDMSVERKISEEYVQSLFAEPDPNAVGDGFDPHQLGAYVAAALWKAGDSLGDHRRIALAVLGAERELGGVLADTPKYDFSTLGFLGRIARQLEGADRDQVCAIFKDRFAALISADPAHPLEGCP